MLRTNWLVTLGLVIALAVTVRVEEGRAGKAQARVAELALAASNAEAERNSTRNVALTARLLGDSLRMAERQVVQVRQRQDALDAALGRARRARYRMSAAVDSLLRAASAATVVDTSANVRRATFGVRQPPYTINARVAIPVPPDSARLAINVALDSIAIDVRLGCGGPDRDGIRAASIDAVTPAWARVRFNRVEQGPDLCASPALARSTGKKEGRLAFAPLTAGIGRALSADGAWSWAFFVGIGFRAW